MKLHERIFRTICKASVCSLIFVVLVCTLYAFYTLLRDEPMFIVSTTSIIVVMILLVNGWRFLYEDLKKREEETRKEIEQFERDAKQAKAVQNETDG